MSTQFSRRRFLQWTGTGVAGLALAACTAAPPGASTGSTGGAAAGEKQQLVFSSYTWSGYEAAMKTVIEAWNQEHPEVEVEGQYIPEDYWTKLQT